MQIKDAKFVKGILGTDPILNDGKKHFVFIGRSNVGKSSLINSLTNNKKLVKSSSMPGKTREINFFLINNDFYFVDLPGYGFAKIKSKQRDKLRKMILWYLLSDETSMVDKKVFLIIDFNVGPTDFDTEMIKVLEDRKIDFLIIANKVDKIGKTLRLRQLKKIREVIGDKEIVLYSAKKNEGREELLTKIF